MCAETAKTRAYRTPASSDAMRRALSDTPRASSGGLDVRTLSGWQKKEPVHKRGPRDMSAYCREAPGGSRLPGGAGGPISHSRPVNRLAPEVVDRRSPPLVHSLA